MTPAARRTLRAACAVGLTLGCRAAPDGRTTTPDTASSARARPAPTTAPCAQDDLARTCVVVGLLAGAPDARLVLATRGDVPDTLVVTLEHPGAPPRRLPPFYGSGLWGQCAPATDARDAPRLDRLAADDVDGDGHADLVVLAECMTGIGPTGAVPFPAGAVYLGDGRGGWRVEERLDSALTDLANGACDSACDVRALAREAVRRGRGGR